MVRQLLLPQPHALTKSYHRPCTNSLFLVSLLFNALCLAIFAKHGQLLSRGRNTDNLQGLGWSRKAAEEAEAAAEYHCSGHGYVFVDTFDMDEKGTPICECNGCFTGPDCSQMVADCVADANSGDPVFLEPFWIANSEAGATVVPAWYRMSYVINDAGGSEVSPVLEKQIRAIHALVGNAVTKGRYIVFGTGSTQLINAAINSLSPSGASNPAQVVAATPYYGAYQGQTEIFDSADNLWKGDARAWIKRTKSLNSTSFIEFVTSPNNPDALLKKAVLEGENVMTIYDHAYYWPHFSAITGPADEDIMLFTLSKLTGHAGSRLGWAIIKDYNVYQKMYRYIQFNTLGVSHDTQLRATRLLRTIINGYGKTRRMEDINMDKKQLIFHYAYPIMRSRWEKIERIFNFSNRFSLQSLGPLYCNFFRKVTGPPSPAYAWVKCMREEEENCGAVLESAGIIGRSGQEFGVSKRYIRLSLLRRDDNFILLERRLQTLVCWAIIKDYNVYQKMHRYIQFNTFGVSHDTQLRATRLLRAIINGYGKTRRMEDINMDKKQLIFHYAYPIMRSRWEKIERIFNFSNRFLLQSLGPLYCNFFRKVTGPSPAYAWVKCMREEEENCGAVLESAGIIGRSGQEFGVSKRYIRLSLLRRDDNFILLERRLQALVWYNNT